jgi:hypothetical protein
LAVRRRTPVPACGAATGVIGTALNQSNAMNQVRRDDQILR